MNRGEWLAPRGVFVLAAGLVLVALMLTGCGASAEDGGRSFQGPADETPAINPTPEKKDGEPSHEFEPSDIERAEEAEQSVREYCEGAVSEAQEVGCLSHVQPNEVP
jgi:hypothetical protein